jgi:hypothetical protein
MQYITIAFGIIFLTAGYQLSWMYVGGITALIMIEFIDQIQIVHNELERISYALAAALGGVLAIYFLRRLMITLAGFFTGGYLALSIPALYGWVITVTPVQSFVIGGIIAAVLILAWFSYGVIIFTSMGGSMLLVNNFSFSGLPRGVIFLLLLVIGLLIQLVMLQYSNPDKEQLTPTDD